MPLTANKQKRQKDYIWKGAFAYLQNVKTLKKTAREASCWEKQMNPTGQPMTLFVLFGFQPPLGGQFLTPPIKPYKFTSLSSWVSKKNDDL